MCLRATQLPHRNRPCSRCWVAQELDQAFDTACLEALVILARPPGQAMAETLEAVHGRQAIARAGTEGDLR